MKVRIDISKGSSLLRNERLGLSFISSCFIHAAAIMLAVIIFHSSNQQQRPDFFPVNVIDMPPSEAEPARKKEVPAPEIKQMPPAPKIAGVKEAKPITKNEIVQPAPAVTQAKEELAKTSEKPSAPVKSENTLAAAPSTQAEGGGNQAGGGNPFGKGDVALAPGPGSGGGGGTAVAGLGRGSGAPGLPAQTAILKTNREAKPLQTVRASYPPMALRMGMEGDVAIRIDVDTEGRVMKAEIVKSAGAGFDEEALKAVKLSRFEPAQKDGQPVPAEFTYIYRFRLR